MSADEDVYHELCAYTLTHGDPRFIHQHVVDAWGAQHAQSDSKPIRLVFSLAGLYLHLERGKTGREVQLIHMKMARRRREWPRLSLPIDRGAVTVVDVMPAAPGGPRDQAIDAWCASVWAGFAEQRASILSILSDLAIDT